MNGSNIKEQVSEMRKKGWKLVRDKLYSNEIKGYENSRFIQLQNDEELFYFLRHKVAEEVIELLKANESIDVSKDILAEEAADIEEALNALSELSTSLGRDISKYNQRVLLLIERISSKRNIFYYEINKRKLEKKEKRGGFDLGVIMQHPTFIPKS